MDPKESSLEFRKRVMDSISTTFCAAKWYDSTIWLNSGMTASCCHTPPEPINMNILANNPLSIHNTEKKLKSRKMLLNNEKPPECQYCWKAEELSKNYVSERVHKTIICSENDINETPLLNNELNTIPRTLELAFDRVCNLNCMYCCPSYSTKWVENIKLNGPFLDLKTDFENHYTSTHESAELNSKNNNVFTEAFWKAWPLMKEKLQTLKITGGEPLLSPNIWKFLECLKSDPTPNIHISIHTNLCVPRDSLERLVEYSKNFKSLEINTSCEAYSAQAEYIRNGLSWEKWISNLEFLQLNSKVKKLTVSGAVNSLSIFSLTELLEHIMNLIKKNEMHEKRRSLQIYLNILVNPHFQSIAILPENIKVIYRNKLSDFLEKYNHDLMDFEIGSIERVIQYLDKISTHPHSNFSKQSLSEDLKRFILKYEQTNKKSHKEIFPEEFTHWIDSIII